MTTTGFSQLENIIYYPYVKAVIAADCYEANAAAATHVSQILGAAYASTSVGSLLLGVTRSIISLKAGQLEYVADQITNYTDQGNNVQVEYVSSSYGQFYNVSSWNGTSCAKTGYTSGSTVVTVNSVVCIHGSVW